MNKLIETCPALDRGCVCVCVCIYSPPPPNGFEVAVSPMCARENEKKGSFQIRKGANLVRHRCQERMEYSFWKLLFRCLISVGRDLWQSSSMTLSPKQG